MPLDFLALPGGSVTPESVFNHSGTQGAWWTSTWNSQVPSGVGCDSCPEFRSTTWHGERFGKWWCQPEYGYSVRCIHSDSVAESQGECNCADIAEGDCDCDGNELDALGVCGGACTEDSDLDGICDDVDDCVEVPEGYCDCDGNELDALGVCGGDCAADVDADGICDDVDDCFGAYDECGICGGGGIAQGSCDCDGNELDALGVCGGDCAADVDAADGICDDIDECVGEFDECEICNGPGAIYECGCADIPEGDCDCDGNALDALGVCGGGCTMDADNDGICDCDASWACGHPYEYQGYSYATVAIGDQCWFAENLRNQAYANGDSIQANWSDADWAYPYDANDNAIGVTRVYGESDNCSSYLDGFDVCASPELSVDAYGRLYNWHAVNDSRNLCPSGWYVPSSDDWMMLTDHLGGAQTAAPSLRSSTGWYGNTGTNASGFSALPGGSVTPESVFNHSGTQGFWWTSTWNSQVPSGVGCDSCPEFRSMTWDGAQLGKWWLPPEYGFSVRCVHSQCIAHSQGECNCADIVEGDCDCEGNQLDALGVCGGDCAADVDADGICDDADDCVGVYDDCGVCNGPGVIYECGCADIPEADCDCDGNQLDAIGVCGGNCAADVDADGICDEDDDCVGAYDECGICNGSGAIYECGCADIQEGGCDCDGNELDALGICGGDCAADVDADGICDDVDDCVVDACGICNGPGAIYECGCADIPEGDCDCDGNALDALGVCAEGAPWMLTMTVYATVTLRGHVDIPMNTKVILTLQ